MKKRITFRVEEPLYSFLKEFSQKNNQTISETVRNILIYFQYGILFGIQRKLQLNSPRLQKAEKKEKRNYY